MKKIYNLFIVIMFLFLITPVFALSSEMNFNFEFTVNASGQYMRSLKKGVVNYKGSWYAQYANGVDNVNIDRSFRVTTLLCKKAWFDTCDEIDSNSLGSSTIRRYNNKGNTVNFNVNFTVPNDGDYFFYSRSTMDSGGVLKIGKGILTSR